MWDGTWLVSCIVTTLIQLLPLYLDNCDHVSFRMSRTIPYLLTVSRIMPFARASGRLAIHNVQVPNPARRILVLRNFTVYMCIAGHIINSGNEMDDALFRLEFYVHLPLQIVDLNGIHIFFIDMQLIVKPFTDLLSHNFWIGFVRTTQRNVYPLTVALVQLWRVYTVNQIEVALTLSDLRSRYALAARRPSKSSASYGC